MGLQTDILKEPISELDIREVIAVRPGATIRSVAALMRQKHLGCVIVVDEAGKPVGKFTERLLMKTLMAESARLDEPISTAMYQTVDCVSLDDPIVKLLRLMQQKSLRFICVTDAEGKAVGLTGQKGLMEYVAEHFPRQVKVQRMRSKLFMDQREGA